MDILWLITQLLPFVPPDILRVLLDGLVIMGGMDLILGVVSKHTKNTVDDNLYSIIHSFYIQVSELIKKRNQQ